MKLFNMVILIPLLFFSFVSNLSVASRKKPHVTQRNVMKLFPAVYTVASFLRYPIRRHFPKSSALELTVLTICCREHLNTGLVQLVK